MREEPPDPAGSGERPWPNARDLGRAGLLLTFAGIDILLVMRVLEAFYPGYSVHHSTISDLLALGAPTSLVGEPMLFLAAVAWMGGAYYLFRGSGRTGLRVLNLLPGTGLLLAVLSPENVNLLIHSIGAVLAFVPGPIAAILSYRMTGSRFRYCALVMGVLSLAGAAIYFGTYETALVQQTLGPGGWERAIVYPLLVWLIGFGSYLLAKSDEVRGEETSRGIPGPSRT